MTAARLRYISDWMRVVILPGWLFTVLTISEHPTWYVVLTTSLVTLLIASSAQRLAMLKVVRDEHRRASSDDRADPSK
jgi:hypothetical protein